MSEETVKLFSRHDDSKLALSASGFATAKELPLQDNLLRYVNRLKGKLRFALEYVESIEAQVESANANSQDKGVSIAIGNMALVDDKISMSDIVKLMNSSEDPELSKLAKDIMSVDEIIQAMWV